MKYTLHNAKNNLKQLREKKNLTHKYLANELGIPATKVKKFEEGIIPLTIEWVCRFAVALNCKPEAISGRKSIRLVEKDSK